MSSRRTIITTPAARAAHLTALPSLSCSLSSLPHAASIDQVSVHQNALAQRAAESEAKLKKALSTTARNSQLGAHGHGGVTLHAPTPRRDASSHSGSSRSSYSSSSTSTSTSSQYPSSNTSYSSTSSSLAHSQSSRTLHAPTSMHMHPSHTSGNLNAMYAYPSSPALYDNHNAYHHSAGQTPTHSHPSHSAYSTHPGHSHSHHHSSATPSPNSTPTSPSPPPLMMRPLKSKMRN